MATQTARNLNYDDIVYVRNAGSADIYGKLSPSRRFVIPPGKTKLMSWMDACLVFGNPFIVDPEERDRRHGQVMCLYGAFDARLDAHLVPEIEVTSEDGDRILMLIEDPNGQHSNVATLDEEDYGDPRLARINAMLAEIAATKAEILAEHTTDPNGRPIANRVGGNPREAMARAAAPAQLDDSSYVAVSGGRPTDFNTIGATDVDGDLLPTGDPHEHALKRPAAWDLPATEQPATGAPIADPASLLLPQGNSAMAPTAAPGPRREGIIIPRQQVSDWHE